MLEEIIRNLPLFVGQFVSKGCLPPPDLRGMYLFHPGKEPLSELHFRQLYQEVSFNNAVALSSDLLDCGINT